MTPRWDGPSHRSRLLAVAAAALLLTLAAPPAWADETAPAIEPGPPPPVPGSITVSAPCAVRAGKLLVVRCAASGALEPTASITVEVCAEGSDVWRAAGAVEAPVSGTQAAAVIPIALARGRYLMRARLEGAAVGLSGPISVAAVGPKVVALTFDDGPSRTTPRILSILAANRVHATFFVLGSLVRKNAGVVRAELRAGHTVGSHSYQHKPLRGRRTALIRYQVAAGKAELVRATGVSPRWFRPPYGSTDARVGSALRAAGMRQVIWTVDALDWEYRSASSVLRRATAGRDGGIVLMHDIYPSTAAALPGIIRSYRSRGFDMVTLDELAALGYRIR